MIDELYFIDASGQADRKAVLDQLGWFKPSKEPRRVNWPYIHLSPHRSTKRRGCVGWIDDILKLESVGAFRFVEGAGDNPDGVGDRHVEADKEAGDGSFMKGHMPQLDRFEVFRRPRPGHPEDKTDEVRPLAPRRERSDKGKPRRPYKKHTPGLTRHRTVTITEPIKELLNGNEKEKFG